MSLTLQTRPPKVDDWRRSAPAGVSLAAAKTKYGSPERDKAVDMAMPDGLSRSLARILRPQAAYRWLLPQLAAITPQYIEMVLRGAMAGSHVQAWELFDLMEDTSPRLMKNANQLKNEVVSELLGWRARPYQDEDEPATETAKEKARLVNAALNSMRPKPTADESAFGGMVYDVMDAWLKGQSALEIDWEVRRAGKLGQIVAPRASFWVHPTCYAWTMQGELGLRMELLGDRSNPDNYTLTPGVWQSTSTQPLPSAVAEFPPDKFLISIHKAKSGTALGGALLRPLAWWWCAANFSADWLLNLAHLFGLPFRWANYDPLAPQATIDSICNMLQNMGSTAWAAFPAGTTLELKEASKSGDNSPQADMLDRCEKQMDLLILGQTLTTDVSKSGGSRAQAEVHETVEGKIVEAAANFVASVLNDQLIPSILRLNYGDDAEDERPTFRGDEEEEGTLTFKREVFKGLLVDSTVCGVLANQTDLKALTKDVGLTVNEEYVDPYIPVADKSGARISGATIKDDEGDIVGGDSIKEPEPKPAPGAPGADGNKANLATNGKTDPEIDPQEPALAGKSAEGQPSPKFEEASREAFLQALAKDLQPVRSRLEAILKISDPQLFESKLRDFLSDLEELQKDILHDPELGQELQNILASSLANGMADAKRKIKR